jgi:hypothetical protein
MLLFTVRLLLAALIAWRAKAYGRAPGPWFLLALFVSPVIAFVVLWALGRPEEEVLSEKEERIRRRHPERTDIREAALNEMKCPRCGAEVNVVTGDGLHTAENEPWLLFCNSCEAQIELDV